MFSFLLEYNGFPGGSDGKESDCDVGDPGLIPGSGRSPGEKKTASHSSIPAWRIPWTEKPGGLQSMGLQRVRHDWVTFTSLHFQNCFTMLCKVLLYNKANQLCIYSLSWTSLPLTPIPTYPGHHRALRWNPRAIQELPTSCLFYTWLCIYVELPSESAIHQE